ncbi:MAG: hypothetical protein HFI38_09640 [Lachnospiraceae bacterium]|jgi:hypothetical protein|nr:hypothetical protein [Lachnospiraceae bacterium]
MDNSFYLMLSGIMFVIALVLGLLAWNCFRHFKRLNEALKRSGEMTATANGSITELVTVTRRNRSFRWTNEYPVISYTANGQTYTFKMDFAEKRRGYYTTGGNYPISYVPSDPSCCIVQDFSKEMKRAKNSNLTGTIILAFFTCNLLVGTVTQLLSMLF